MDRFASNSIASRTRSRYLRTANMVFGIELLREMILDYAIHDDEGIVQPSNVQSCRLVNKAWLQSTSKVLLKSQEPLFMFQIDPKSSNDMEENGTQDLQQFLNSVTGASRLEERIPPYSIRLSAHNFPELNQQILENVFECFVKCVGGLINLNLGINDAHHSTLWLNTKVLLPKLRKFNVSIKNINVMPHRKTNEKIDYIQTVLNSTEQLKSFVFTCDEDSNQLKVSLGSLTLPRSVTQLYFDCLPYVGALEALVKNPLSKLTKLKFRVEGLRLGTDSDGIITGILQKVGKTLKKLHVKQTGRQDSLDQDPDDIMLGYNEDPTTFQLPLMEILQSLKVNTPLLELQGNPSSLEELVPQLKHLTLRNQKIPTFRKWVDRSCFHSVTSLTVSLRRENIHNSLFYRINFDSDTLAALNKGFPNVQKLDITFPTLEPEVPVLSVLWEMKNLKSLRIYFGSLNPHPFYTLDACLLGIPPQPLEEDLPLEQSPGIMEKLQNLEGPSIRSLTNLQKLILISYQVPCCYALSSVTFDFGFFKMPNLKNLTLDKCFIPSGEVKEKWEKEGRSFTAVETYYHRDRYENNHDDDSDN